MDGKLLLAAAVVAATGVVIAAQKSRRKTWCRPWLKRRCEGRGILGMLNSELKHEDEWAYTNFLRLTVAQFDFLLSKIESDITKVDTNMREAISARHK